MAQFIKVLATKPHYLNLVPGTSTQWKVRTDF